MRYILELNEEQAKVVSTACEVFARIKMGQFNEIVWHCAEKHCVDDPEEVQRLWLKLRKHIYPELIEHAGHSYGMGKFRDADLAFDVHQVIRRHFGDPREPFSYHELPRCYVESDRHSIVLEDGCKYCKEDREGYRTMLGAFSITNPFHGEAWYIETCNCKPRKIRFCPMCGRKLVKEGRA